MLALSLLLCAAAGVNAIIGGEVSKVEFPDGSYFCADNCVYRDVFFVQRGYYCPSKEAVTLVDKDNNFSPLGIQFDCAGAPPIPGYGPRQRANGEELDGCERQPKNDEEYPCISNKSTGSFKNGKTLQWSEVEKSLKSTISEDEQGTPEKNQDDDMWVWQ